MSKKIKTGLKERAPSNYNPDGGRMMREGIWNTAANVSTGMTRSVARSVELTWQNMRIITNEKFNT